MIGQSARPSDRRIDRHFQTGIPALIVLPRLPPHRNAAILRTQSHNQGLPVCVQQRNNRAARRNSDLMSDRYGIDQIGRGTEAHAVTRAHAEPIPIAIAQTVDAVHQHSAACAFVV